MQWQIILKESLFLFLATSIGFYRFKQLNRFFRLHFFQVVLALVFYFAAWFVTMYQSKNNLPLNNQWLYNIYILLEGLVLISAGFFYFKERGLKQLLRSAIVIFLSVFFVQILTSDYLHFANFAFIVEGILVTLIYIFIIYRSIAHDQANRIVLPEFWLGLGLVLYFACNAPYFGLLHYLHEIAPELNGKLFYFITEVLGNIRYFLAATSFYFCSKYQKAMVARNL